MKAVPELELASITQQMLTGQIDKMPGEVTLNLANASASDYQALLELVR